jgi:predicted amino acid dehydrogenase
MQRFLDKTKGVAATGVVGVISKVWWAASEQRELRVLRDAVARRRAALSVLIGSSNLFVSLCIERYITH